MNERNDLNSALIFVIQCVPIVISWCAKVGWIMYSRKLSLSLLNNGCPLAFLCNLIFVLSNIYMKTKDK